MFLTHYFEKLMLFFYLKQKIPSLTLTKFWYQNYDNIITVKSRQDFAKKIDKKYKEIYFLEEVYEFKCNFI